MERATPEGLNESWDRALHDPDAVRALGASRVLFKEISRWQSDLVAEAIRGGATWEDVGDALGTTRQAAWARFRTLAERMEGRSRPMAEQIDAVKDRFKDEVQSLRNELKHLDAKWRQEHRELEERRKEDRKAIQEKIKDAAASLREEIQRLRA